MTGTVPAYSLNMQQSSHKDNTFWPYRAIIFYQALSFQSTGQNVYLQLQSFLYKNNIFEIFQSGFKFHHSTGSTLLRIFKDLAWVIDSVVLILLDVTGVFSTVEHKSALSDVIVFLPLLGSSLTLLMAPFCQHSHLLS